MAYLGGQILIISVITVGLVLSFSGGYYLNRSIADSNLKKTNLELKENLEKIKENLPEIQEVRSLEGIVKSVWENAITIDVAPLPNPLDKWPLVRDIIVTKETKILHRGVESTDVLQKEFEENKKITSVYLEKEIELRDIKPGRRVFVEAGEDIKTKPFFEATRILFQDEGSSITDLAKPNLLDTVPTTGIGVPLPPSSDLPKPPISGSATSPASVMPPSVPPANPIFAPPPTISSPPTGTGPASQGSLPPPPALPPGTEQSFPAPPSAPPPPL